jgi:hypothetical protein
MMPVACAVCLMQMCFSSMDRVTQYQQFNWEILVAKQPSQMLLYNARIEVSTVHSSGLHVGLLAR